MLINDVMKSNACDWVIVPLLRSGKLAKVQSLKCRALHLYATTLMHFVNYVPNVNCETGDGCYVAKCGRKFHSLAEQDWNR